MGRRSRLLFAILAVALSCSVLPAQLACDAGIVRLELLTEVMQEGVLRHRLHLNLAEGWAVQAVFGNEEHPLVIRSDKPILDPIQRWSTPEYSFGKDSDHDDEPDSWLGIRYESSTASDSSDDSSDQRPQVMYSGLPNESFGDVNNGHGIVLTNGAWFVLNGLHAPEGDSAFCLGEIYSSGRLEYELNLQLIDPTGIVHKVFARAGNARIEECVNSSLKDISWPSGQY